MKISVIASIIVGLAVVAARLSFAADVTLNLLPANGAVTGPSGSTVGWGYSISNNTSDWLLTTNLSADVFQDGTPNAIFDFPTIAPNSSVTLDFSLVATGSCASPPCGLYDLTWAPAAPDGFNNIGSFIVSSELYSADPATSGAVDLGPAQDVSASYSATVGGIVTPEPASLSLFVAGLVAAAVLFRFKHRHTHVSCD